jgi:23S rRNA pseudouridine1911/1915/1917 synthase
MTLPSTTQRTVTVADDETGERLDRVLARHVAELSRSRLKVLIENGAVALGAHTIRDPARRVNSGDTLSVNVPPPEPAKPAAEPIPLRVVYEDNDIIVIDKPRNLVVHPAAGHATGTLVNALIAHCGDSLSGIGGVKRPGIVHRLDKETSGLIIVAKNDEAHRKLAEQFAKREVKKTYIALVHGWLKKDRGTISASISRDPVRRIRMTTRGTGGREAISHYNVVRRLDTVFGKFTLIEVRIDTGRTHQIRVHMASVGHPVVGDALYGAPKEMRARRGRATDEGAAISLPRNFLHAAQLELTHPRTGERIALKSPIPPELQAFLESVEKDIPSSVSTKGG